MTGDEILNPQTFDLAVVFTAAGIPIAGGIIASFIQVLKRIPYLGTWLSTEANARLMNVLLSLGLIGYAFYATGIDPTPTSGFMGFLAWVNLAAFTDAAYRVAPENVKTALSGTGQG